MESIVQEFYSDLFRSAIAVPRCSILPAQDVHSTMESEFALAIRSMKKDTVPASNNMSADLLRAGCSSLH